MLEATVTLLIRCPSQGDLQAFILGELPLDTIEAIGAHLATCESCTAFMDERSARADTSIDGLRSALKDTATAFDDLAAEPECQKLQERAERLLLADDAPTKDLPRTSTPRPAATAADSDEMHIAGYLNIKELGRGYFATVYLARDSKHERLVAIKVARRERYSDELIQLFRREAKTAAALDHENIVPVLDYGELTDGRPYIVMRYIEGKSLAEALKSEVISHKRAAKIVAEVAKGLHYAHQKGLVHRDIKPANILLDKQGKPLIADFGLAINDDWALHPEAFAGTVHYMSPEQIRSADDIPGTHRHIDSRSDIWSLGVVFYQLLTNKLPFNGKSQDDWREQIVYREPRAPRSIDHTIPVELERVTLECLRKSIPDRPPTARDVAQRVERWLFWHTWFNRQTIAITASCALLLIAFLLLLNGNSPFGLASSVATMFSSPPKGNEGPSSGVAARPFVLDAFAKPNLWTPLLDVEPVPRIWPAVPTADRMRYDENRQEFDVSINRYALFDLGQTSSPTFQVQVNISKANWLGSAGLFLGHKRSPTDASLEQCEVIWVHGFPGDARTEVQIRRTIISFRPLEDPRVGPQITTLPLAAATVPMPTRDGNILELHVLNGALSSVFWRSTPLPSLISPLPPDAPASDCVGVLGLIAENCHATFRDARFFNSTLTVGENE